MFKNRKYKTPRAISGQSTVEYIVLVTAVIAVIIFFVAPAGKNKQSVFQNKVVNMINETTEGMLTKSSLLDGSHSDTVDYHAPQNTITVTDINSLFGN